ncbi:MAG TPA: hypothetical protein VMR98_05430, partial [Candidatus Polarisedimenticolaceae bacterium]|nr:hypothetical protein [Candidatus Polarisedimenticolaceae bacterium]
MKQMSIFDIPSEDCPFKGLTEDYDTHCNESSVHPHGYQVISENSPFFAESLAAVRGIGFDDVKGEQPSLPTLPGYVPSVSHGSTELFSNYSPNYVAVGLNQVISPIKLSVTTDIRRRFGIPATTKIVLMCYGK